jgi:undecaprenyl diphosphate synthase
MPDIDPQRLPKHVAIIMDGNGRWAKKRTLNRIRGHEQGAESVREIVRTNRKIGISWLTLYAFSEENWKRPKHEVQALMRLLKKFLKSELDEMLENGIRFQTIGRTGKLPPLPSVTAEGKRYSTPSIKYLKGLNLEISPRVRSLNSSLPIPFIRQACLTQTCS